LHLTLLTRLSVILSCHRRSSALPSPSPYTTLFRSVAVIDQSFGTSTPRCSKIVLPFSFWMEAVRISHSISSKGSIPVFVKNRLTDRKSTRLNSSHGSISYDVFCLKKKNVLNY